MNEDAFDDLALQRLSVPATAPGGMSRRKFMQLVGGGAGLAAGAVALGPTLDQLRAFAAPPVGPNDGILVLLMLDGGNDGLNTLIPYGSGEYYDKRPHIKIPANQVLPLNSPYGLHPRMTRMKAMYDQGKVAVLRGVGYNPPDLSHFTSMGIWMNGWSGGQPAGRPHRVDRPLPRRPAERGQRVPARRGRGQLGPAAHGRPRRPARRACPGTSAARSESTAATRTRRGSSTPSPRSAAPRPSSVSGEISSARPNATRWTWPSASNLRTPVTFPDSDLGRKLVLCARLINANLGVRVLLDEPERLRHALGPADLARRPDGRPRRVRRHVLRRPVRRRSSPG